MKYKLKISCKGGLSAIEKALMSDSSKEWEETSSLAQKALKMLTYFWRE